MKQKGFAPILIIILVLITIAGAYYFGTKKGTIIPTPTQTQVPDTNNIPAQITPATAPTTDPTTNWKTYTHPTYKYQFKYPNEWLVAVSKYASAETLFGPNASPTMGLGGVEVRELDIQPQDFYKLTGSKVVESNAQTINGISGYRYVYSNIMTSNGFVFKNTDGLIYNIYINTNNDQGIELFNKLLSTFKFTR